MSNLYATPSAGRADESAVDSAASTPSTEAAAHTANVASDEAARVGHTVAQAATHVTEVTKNEAGKVAAETKMQAKDLLKDARSQLTEQAGEQQVRVATGLRSISGELDQMVSASETDGMATDLVRQAASRAEHAATWLDDRDPGSLLEEVRSFARRKPGTFIALAAVAGVLAGRLTRSVSAEAAGPAQAPDTAASKAVSSAAEPAHSDTAVSPTVNSAGQSSAEPFAAASSNVTIASDAPDALPRTIPADATAMFPDNPRLTVNDR